MNYQFSNLLKEDYVKISWVIAASDEILTCLEDSLIHRLRSVVRLAERTPLPCWRRPRRVASVIGRTAIPSARGNERASRCWRRSTRKASRRPAKNGTRHVTRLWDSTTPYSPPRAPAAVLKTLQPLVTAALLSGYLSIFPPRLMKICAVDVAKPCRRVDFYRSSPRSRCSDTLGGMKRSTDRDAHGVSKKN